MTTIRVLPILGGRLGVASRSIYVVLAVLTTIVIIGSVIFNGLDFFRNMPADASWGLRTFSSVHAGDPPYVGWVSPAARSQGLRVHDTIAAVQGTRLPSNATEFDIGARLAAVAGNHATVVVQHPNGSGAAVILQREPHPWLQPDFNNDLPLWLSATTSFLNIELIPIFLLGASLLLFSRRPRDAEAMLFATGFLLLCNIPVSDFWLLAILDMPTWVASDLLAAGQCIVLIAAAGFPDGRYDSRWSRAVLIAAVPLTVFNRVAHSLAPNARVSGALSATILLLLGGVAMIGLSRRYRLLPAGPARQQIKWVVLGFCVSAIASAAYMGLLQSNVQFSSAGPQFVAFQLLQLFAFVALPLGLVVSLLRYRLYDAEATISRSAAYAVLTVSLVALFAATEKLIELFGSTFLGGNIGAVAGGISAGIAAVMIAPLHHRIDRWAKRRFQRGLLRLREGLPALVGDLREVASTDQIARAVLERVTEGVHASHAALIGDCRLLAARNVSADEVWAWQARANKGMARIERADPLFPLRLPVMVEEETRIGHLLLGPRPDGSFYGADELETLDEIIDPVARAIMISRQRETADASVADKIQVLVEEVSRMKSVLLRHGLT